MSNSGKLARGEKYLSNIVAIEQPGYLPYGEVFMAEGILNDPNKMKDIDYYNKNKPKKEVTSEEKETKPVEKPKTVEKPVNKTISKVKEE